MMVIADIYRQVKVIIVCFIVFQGFRLMTQIGFSLRNVSDNLGLMLHRHKSASRNSTGRDGGEVESVSARQRWCRL